MLNPTFAASPLITPQRLKDDREEALKLRPSWADVPGLNGSDLSLEEDAAVLLIGQINKIFIYISVVMLALLYELTRYGNSVAANGNGKPSEGMHGRLTFSLSSKDNQTIQRIVMDVGAYFRVELGKDRRGRRDLRAENLSVVRDGKAIKAAREVAVRHAVALAKAADADWKRYEENLWALFRFHDLLHLGAADY